MPLPEPGTLPSVILAVAGLVTAGWVLWIGRR
jgi:hypothetical protein